MYFKEKEFVWCCREGETLREREKDEPYSSWIGSLIPLFFALIGLLNVCQVGGVGGDLK